jgi:hypothetical protein
VSDHPVRTFSERVHFLMARRQPLRKDATFIGGFHGLFFALEPGHKRLLTIQEVPLLLGEAGAKAPKTPSVTCRASRTWGLPV